MRALRRGACAALLLLASLVAIAAPGRAADAREPAEQAAPAQGLRELARGLASWYGGRFHGRRTASGERFDQHALTAAHPTLPFGTIVRVQSLVNGRFVDVRINDRGPHIKRRIIDLSRAAAQRLGLLDVGTGIKPVILHVLPPAGRGEDDSPGAAQTLAMPAMPDRNTSGAAADLQP